MFIMILGFDWIGEENVFVVFVWVIEFVVQGCDIINLGIGQFDFQILEYIVEVVIKVFCDGYYGYMLVIGIVLFCEVVCQDLEKRYGVGLNLDNVFIVFGGKVMMFMVILMFGELGVDIFYLDFGFLIYWLMIEFIDVWLVLVLICEENDFVFLVDEMLDLIMDKICFFIFNLFVNLIGGVILWLEIEKLVVGLECFLNIVVLFDEIYLQMIYEDVEYVFFFIFLVLCDWLILFDGWLKIYVMIGWCLGYFVWFDGLMDKVCKLVVNVWFCVNVLV